MGHKLDFNIPENASRLNYVRGLLAAHRIRSREIARSLGIKDSTVSHLLAGRTKSRRVQKAIAEALNMSFEDVWGTPE
jgi:transcriptional regulator with XRE-family HTH domain